ncbi:FAD/NAD(P)-binding domain-containing protein [Calocera viscosa TUFC12733]|uniref:FAD/NAD(P)-binding domain-containing protein n=1 Tax=Calocera viscosa (strain TUFC12733) TaxID=1330018 RepID=A0A167GKQ9_CALVF|nr:FAD/NAD(P)-binding domain-containing protein [Calocera viscosa TUFC12733]
MKSSKRIAIIGGGAAGLAVLKVLLELPQVRDKTWHVVCYEARDDIGGVWLPAPPTSNPPDTPLYDSLTTNLPHPIMAFQTLSFPSSTLLFPPARAVLAYLRSYATTFGLHPFLRLGRRVERLTWDAREACWELVVSPGGGRKHYDAVIVCNGHYSLPRYPSTLGFSAWLSSGKIPVTHSAWYRNPLPWKGKVVLVLGGGPSGTDVTSELATVAKKVYHSVTGFTKEDVGNVSRRPRPREFTQDGKVIFEDGSIASDIEAVIPATGYQYAYPFLSPPLLVPQPTIASPDIPSTPPPHLSNDSMHLYALARHIWPLQRDFPAHTLAFIGLPARVIPFPIFEAQARCVVRVLQDPERLNIPRELALVHARDEELAEQCKGNAREMSKSWHRLPDEEQFSYRTELLAFAGVKEWQVEPWAHEVYAMKGDLRAAWRAIEARGEGEKWVEGVGEGGTDEWVDLIRRVYKDGQKRREGEGGEGEKVRDPGRV